MELASKLWVESDDQLVLARLITFFLMQHICKMFHLFHKEDSTLLHFNQKCNTIYDIILYIMRSAISHDTRAPSAATADRSHTIKIRFFWPETLRTPAPLFGSDPTETVSTRSADTHVLKQYTPALTPWVQHSLRRLSPSAERLRKSEIERDVYNQGHCPG